MTVHYISYLEPTVLFLLFCVSHSLLAKTEVKLWLFSKYPLLKPFYRLLYNSLSLLFLLLWLMLLPADIIIYRITGFWAFMMVFVQLLSAAGAVYSLKGHGAVFLGIRQVLRYIRHKQMPDYLDEPQKGTLIKTRFYKYMRHPLYTFSILILACSPVMTVNLIYIIIFTVLYFYVGSYFEEKGLVKRFGDDYKSYQEEVPRFIPNLFDILRR